MKAQAWWMRWSPVLALSTAAVAGRPSCNVFIEDDAYWNLRGVLNCDNALDAGADADSGPPAECVPSLAGAPVDDSCGVFVSSSLGDDANVGNAKSAPVKTLKQALMLGAQRNLPVYACAEVFNNADTETLNVSAGSLLFGGLDCGKDWAYIGDTQKSIVQGSADQIAMVLRTGSGITRLDDFGVRAADAATDGGSSIAVLSEPDLSVQMNRCELIAGFGKDGAKGITPTDDIGPTDPSHADIKGGSGANAGSGDLINGNPGGTGTTNPKCMSAVGGNGGAGFVDHGEDGTDGMPALGAGKAGVGQPVMDMGNWDCIVGIGQLGKNGASGTQGASATDTELGILDLNGFMSAAGQNGTDGLPGQGGGGAGAAKGKTGTTGASGGGGGAGGCGGKGGGGGQGGGASIALASLGSAFAFNGVLLSAANGGRGGDGSDGQVGATGGAGGTGGTGDPSAPATLDGCNGGTGGKGGQGGPGGAGRGGHSVGLMHLGPAPSLDGLNFSVGTPGEGGSAFMSNAAAGIASNTLALP